MTTVAQMIEYLKTLPQDAEVECGYEMSRGYSYSFAMGSVDLDATCIFDYTNEEERKRAGKLAGKIIVKIHSGDY